MALDYCNFQYLFYMFYVLFFGYYLTLVNIADSTLSKLRYLIFTKSKPLSVISHSILKRSSSYCTSCTALLPHADLWPCLCLCMVLQTILKWFILPHPPHFCHMPFCFCGYPMLQYLQFSTILFSLPLPFHCLILPCLCLYLLTESNSFASLKLSSTSLCAICASTLWTHINTCLPLTSLVSFKAINSFIISAILFSLSRPLISCSFSLLSYSLYL